MLAIGEPVCVIGEGREEKEGIRETAILSVQFFYESKTALENKVYI